MPSWGRNMDKKTKELIALGAAYAVNCQPCMELHKQQAAEAGANAQEMRAAIEVAESVKKGAYDKAKKSAGHLFVDLKEERCCPEGSKCCS